jgi:toxin secretion/phage lysis holin
MEGKKMENLNGIWTFLQGIIATIGGFLGWFMGGVDGLLYALVALVVIDYITCLVCAIAAKNLSSLAGFKVIAQKVLIFVLVAVGYIIDQHVIGEGDVCRMAVIFFYLSNEGVVLLENAAFLGLPLPDKLKDVLATIGTNTNRISDTE